MNGRYPMVNQTGKTSCSNCPCLSILGRFDTAAKPCRTATKSRSGNQYINNILGTTILIATRRINNGTHNQHCKDRLQEKFCPDAHHCDVHEKAEERRDAKGLDDSAAIEVRLLKQIFRNGEAWRRLPQARESWASAGQRAIMTAGPQATPPKRCSHT